MSTDRIPEAVYDDIMAYVQKGQPLGEGSFVEALIFNNLVEAFRRADDRTRAAMHSIVAFVYNDLPSACFGSRAVALAWRRYAARAREAENAGDETTETGEEIGNLLRAAYEAKAYADRFNK